MAAPAPASAALSVEDFSGSVDGFWSSLLTASVADSAARLPLRPRLVPKRFKPPPMPLAVASGSLTALATPLPTFSTEVPAAFMKTSVFEISSRLVRASISCTRITSRLRPSASIGP